MECLNIGLAIDLADLTLLGQRGRFWYQVWVRDISTPSHVSVGWVNSQVRVGVGLRECGKQGLSFTYLWGESNSSQKRPFKPYHICLAVISDGEAHIIAGSNVAVPKLDVIH